MDTPRWLWAGLLCGLLLLPGLLHAGENPAYSEVELASRINSYVDDVKRCLEKKFRATPGKYHDLMDVSLSEDECFETVHLGWMIIAAGEHYRGSDVLKAALFRVKNEVGWVTPPARVCWEEQREQVVSLFMRDASSYAEDTSIHRPFEGTHLAWLAQQAMDRITKRSGYKFEGYRGLEILGG